MGPRSPAMLLLLLLRTAYGSLGKIQSRNRRGIFELAGVVKCSTGRSAISYIRYGCYCGLGGRGWPRDAVDWCCFKHDCCYSKAEQAGCQPKTGRYDWECNDKSAVCDSEDECQEMMCECDSKAAKCFAKAPYNSKYIFWPDFKCGGRQPKCKD